MSKESLIEKIKLSFVIGFLITIVIFVLAYITGLQAMAKTMFFTVWLLSFVGFFILTLVKDNLTAKKWERAKKEKTESASWWEAIPELVLWIVGMTLFVAILFVLLFAGVYANNQFYGWHLADGSMYHDHTSVLFPEKLEIINMGKDSLALEVDSTKVEFASTVENGEYIQTVKFSEPGNYTVWVNSDPLTVRVFASASEMEAQQEPGFEGIAVFIAFAGILAIAKRNRKGG